MTETECGVMGRSDCGHRRVTAYRMVDLALRYACRLLPPAEWIERCALWWGVRYRPAPRVVRLRSGPSMLVDPTDYLQSIIYYFGAFEPHCLRLVQRCLGEGSVFLDVGANIGVYTLTAAAAVGRGGRVVAIEAAPANVKLLQDNIGRNGFSQVTVVAVAVGSDPGTAVIRRPTGGNRGMFTLGQVDGVDEASVPVRRLDAVLSEQQCSNVDVVKMDIEGSEYRALQGATDLVRRCLPTFFLEINDSALRACGSSATDVKELLNDAGYQGWIIGRRGLTRIEAGMEHRCDECLFVHPNRPAHWRCLGLGLPQS